MPCFENQRSSTTEQKNRLPDWIYTTQVCVPSTVTSFKNEI